MAKNDFQYGGWNSYTVPKITALKQYLNQCCGTIMTLISPGDCTPQCGTWHWDHDIEFARWQHPAMWHVALGS